MNGKPVSDLALRLSAVDQFQTTLVLKYGPPSIILDMAVNADIQVSCDC